MEGKKKVNSYSIKKNKSKFEAIKISSSQDASKFIRQLYGDDLVVYESFFILLLDRSNHVVGYAKIGQGGIAGTYVDIKIIAKYAIGSLASSIILSHNHPSGNINPSHIDIQVTKKIKEAMSLIDINVFDHIIITENSYYSFADEGKLINH